MQRQPRHVIDCLIALALVGEAHEPKALGEARGDVHHDVRLEGGGVVGLEKGEQICICDRKCEVAHERRKLCSNTFSVRKHLRISGSCLSFTQAVGQQW